MPGRRPTPITLSDGARFLVHLVSSALSQYRAAPTPSNENWLDVGWQFDSQFASSLPLIGWRHQVATARRLTEIRGFVLSLQRAAGRLPGWADEEAAILFHDRPTRAWAAGVLAALRAQALHPAWPSTLILTLSFLLVRPPILPRGVLRPLRDAFQSADPVALDRLLGELPPFERALLVDEVVRYFPYVLFVSAVPTGAFAAPRGSVMPLRPRCRVDWASIGAGAPYSLWDSGDLELTPADIAALTRRPSDQFSRVVSLQRVPNHVHQSQGLRASLFDSLPLDFSGQANIAAAVEVSKMLSEPRPDNTANLITELIVATIPDPIDTRTTVGIIGFSRTINPTCDGHSSYQLSIRCAAARSVDGATGHLALSAALILQFRHDRRCPTIARMPISPTVGALGAGPVAYDVAEVVRSRLTAHETVGKPIASK